MMKYPVGTDELDELDEEELLDDLKTLWG